MATTLAAPLILRQSIPTNTSDTGQRRWKRERTLQKPAQSDVQAEAAWTSRVKLDPSLIEAAHEEWGLATTSSITAANATCATSWNEHSIEASCSYLQRPSSVTHSQSLDHWDASISFSPYTSSCLESARSLDTVPPNMTRDPKKGRVLAIGRDDGTVTLLRALRRSEDRTDTVDNLPDTSVSLTDMSRSGSSSTLSTASYRPSPDTEARSINLSSSKRFTPTQLSPIQPHNRSFTSLTSRSTVSTPSTHTHHGPAVNVHVEESTPISSVEVTVTATGHTASSGTDNHEAEHALEAQMAAADRNDHQHGIVGGVIERLGFSHHHARTSGSHDAGTTMMRSRSNTSGTGAHSTARPETSQPKPPAVAEKTAPRETNVHTKEQEGQFETIYTIAGSDRSSVVALRALPIPTSITGRRGVGLLVVQEEGSVSFWSVDDGQLLWEADLASPALIEKADAKPAVAAPVVAQSNPRRLLGRSDTPLSRSPVGSLRTKASRADLTRASKLKLESRPDGTTRDVVGVKLASDAQVFRSPNRDRIAVWDSVANAMLFVALDSGVLVAKETVEDLHSACIPSIKQRNASSADVLLIWLDTSSTIQTRPVKESASFTTDDPASSTVSDLSTSSSPSDSPIVLPHDLNTRKIFFTPSAVLTISGDGLKTFDCKDARERSAASGVIDIIGSTRDSQQIIVKTGYGTAMFDTAVQGAEVEEISNSLVPAQMYLTWNTLEDKLLHKLFALDPNAGNDEDVRVIDWDSSKFAADGSEARLATPSACSADWISAVLPLSLERVVIAARGGLRLVTFLELAAGSLKPDLEQSGNSIGEHKDICLLRLAVTPQSGTRFILGATRQGDVACWDATTLRLVSNSSRCISTSPVEALILFGDQDNTIRLHGCVACVSADSSITMILLDTFKTQYMIPGRGARLVSIATRADEILLIYDDGKARVWDLRTQELRRSIGIDQAQALVEDGKGWWNTHLVNAYDPSHSGTTGVLSQLAAARETFSASLLVDFRRAIEAASRSVNPVPTTASGRPDATAEAEHTVEDEDEPLASPPSQLVNLGTPAARKAMSIIRPLIMAVYPAGISQQLDKKFSVLLDIHADNGREFEGAALIMGLHFLDAFLAIPSSNMQDARRSWTFHSRLTTLRSLLCCTLLRVLAKIQELRMLALELAQFVEGELHSVIGPDFADVSLDILAPFLLDNNEEVRRSSRALFNVAMLRMDESQVEQLCEIWHPQLPCLRPIEMVASDEARISFALLGNIAVERFTWMSPKLLKDIAMSIQQIIASATKNESGERAEPLQYRLVIAIAIDLCRSGFSIWQHYFDATEIVRSLFALSTTGPGSHESESGQRELARKATLQIAQDNTPLFMTTLSLDILHARSAAHCAATMRLVAFMVRKRPLVLLPSLPRLAEAVVKSLDPTVTEMREAVVNAATVMIGELVSTYPTIAFHGRGQRLAVGTHEGAVIMYDLKTATRLYVIEGHRQPLNGCSFSPDGRRLVTLSLVERKLLVWKVGTGFTSFFTPGTIPRQGGTDPSGAYRSFDFNVGSSLSDSSASVSNDLLKAVQFEWHDNQRGVRVQLGPAQINISVD